MDQESRLRLKTELLRLGIRAKDLSAKLGFADTYVSRLVSGNITEPSASRIQAICNETGIDWGYILTGVRESSKRDKLIEEIKTAPDDIIDQVETFVRISKLKGS